MDLVRQLGWGGKAGGQLQTMQLWNNIYKSSVDDYEWGCHPEEFLAYDYRSNGYSMYATISDTLPSESPVLMIGAGSSLLGEAIYDHGYEPMVQTDFSEVVVERRKLAIDKLLRPHMFWDFADARKPMNHLLQHIQNKDPTIALSQHDTTKWQRFGGVVDKGLIDALYLSGGESMEDIPKIVSNVAKVLNPQSGVFVTLSYSSPKIMTPLLKNKYFKSIEARLMESADIYLYRMCRGDN
jgi:hypothetical protein